MFMEELPRIFRTPPVHMERREMVRRPEEGIYVLYKHTVVQRNKIQLITRKKTRWITRPTVSTLP